MNNTINFEELEKDSAFINALCNAESVTEVTAIMAAKDIAVSADTATEVLNKIQDCGELSEDNLDEVAGGAKCLFCAKEPKGNMVWHIVKHLLGF